MALAATSADQAASVGYEGTASDGLTQLDAGHALTSDTSAPDGHIVATEDVTPGGSGHEVTLALGLRPEPGPGRGHRHSLAEPPVRPDRGQVPARLGRLRRRAEPRPLGQGPAEQDPQLLPVANVLKASEDKTYPGAIVASLASPWGQSVPPG
jgi:glucoamylase